MTKSNRQKVLSCLQMTWLHSVLGMALFVGLFHGTNTTALAKDYQYGGGVIIEKQSTLPFRAAIAKVQRAIKGARFIIVGEPNYQLMQRMVGRERAGAKGFFLYRPDLGIPVFDNDPKAAMEIPLKIVIWEGADGKGIIRYKQPSSLLADYKALGDLGSELDQLMVKISDAGVK
ncbi:MAG TPA: DUF302 domain-containing protein [Nitrospirales bacterium]|nr:hypothetical protein [Nitrospiraceae bacterium]HNP30299.1 DUF302 domain-containing protein [Nitrospirales bacterium]